MVSVIMKTKKPRGDNHPWSGHMVITQYQQLVKMNFNDININNQFIMKMYH